MTVRNVHVTFVAACVLFMVLGVMAVGSLGHPVSIGAKPGSYGNVTFVRTDPLNATIQLRINATTLLNVSPFGQSTIELRNGHYNYSCVTYLTGGPFAFTVSGTNFTIPIACSGGLPPALGAIPGGWYFDGFSFFLGVFAGVAFTLLVFVLIMAVDRIRHHE